MEFKTVNIEIFTIMRTSLFRIMVVVQEIIGPVDIIRFVALLSHVLDNLISFFWDIQGKNVLTYFRVWQLGSYCHQLIFV
jgi:hypothetical protein